MAKYDLTYLSLGAGVQSTALLIMSALGLHGCPKADVAIFADTGDEPGWVYEHLWRLAEWSTIPIQIVQRGHLSEEFAARKRAGGRFACVPSWTRGADLRAAPLRRQCTREYKIEPIQREVRRILSVPKGHRVKAHVQCLLGISRDEADRMTESRERWITNRYPLVEARLRRGDCEKIASEQFGYAPKKSSCVFCPYHSDVYWRDLKAESPVEFQRAVAFDELIRDSTKFGVISPTFLHRSLKPLAEIDFTDRQGDLFSEECAGVCGV